MNVITLLTLVNDDDYVKGYSHIHIHLNEEWMRFNNNVNDEVLIERLFWRVVKWLSHNMGFLVERLFSYLNLWAFKWMNVGFGMGTHPWVEADYLVTISYPLMHLM